MTDKMALAREWKHRLGLDDWEIDINAECAPNEMTLEEVDGCTVWTECNKTARMEILAEEHYGERIRPYDFERILVHEFLHLKLSIVSDQVEPTQARYMHQIIDDLARAFVSAKHNEVEE